MKIEVVGQNARKCASRRNGHSGRLPPHPRPSSLAPRQHFSVDCSQRTRLRGHLRTTNSISEASCPSWPHEDQHCHIYLGPPFTTPAGTTSHSASSHNLTMARVYADVNSQMP